MTHFTALLGEKLCAQDGAMVPTCEALAGKKAVALYFSAHWCPPCRNFTPKLAEYYAKTLQAKGLEVVFISSDKDKDAFKEYFAEQPWLALPYDAREMKEALSKKYKVKGIPSLVVLDAADGTTITTDGTSSVMNDSTGDEFPWRPKPLPELLGDSFLKGTNTVGKEALAGKVLGIYFSAHWCPPCRSFTPKLVDAYKAMQAKGLNFEVLFASSDRDEASFKDYYGEMPWLALPHGDARKEALSRHFQVSGIPSFVILDEDLRVITKEGRGAIMADPCGEEFPWIPKPVQDAARPTGIEETPSLVVFIETLPKEEQDAVEMQVEGVARRYIEAAKEAQEEDPKYLFFAARKMVGAVPRIRQLTSQPSLPPAKHEHPLEERPAAGGWGCDGCNCSGASSEKRFRCSQGCDFDLCATCFTKSAELAPELPARAVLINLEDDGAYFELEGEVTEASVQRFLETFERGELTRKQIGA